MATLGNCWPVGVAITIDLLVLRTALIPATPRSYGEHPKRPVWRERIVQRVAHIDSLRGREERVQVLQQLAEEMQTESEQTPPATFLPRRTSMGLSIDLKAPLTPRRREAPTRAKPAEDPPLPGKKTGRKHR